MALRLLAKELCGKLGTSFACAGPQRILTSPVLLTRLYASNVPEDLKYQKSHEWVKVKGDTATIGISDFAQEQLGDVVYVELPDVGTQLDKGMAFGVVESVKTASDVYMPVTGEIVARNEDVVASPEKVNEAPYEGGWLISVKLSNPGEVSELLDSAAYAKETENH